MSNVIEIPFETTLLVRDSCLCLHVQRAARALARRFDEALRPLGLTNGQFSLMMSLNRPEPAAMGPGRDPARNRPDDADCGLKAAGAAGLGVHSAQSQRSPCSAAQPDAIRQSCAFGRRADLEGDACRGGSAIARRQCRPVAAGSTGAVLSTISHAGIGAKIAARETNAAFRKIAERLHASWR